MHFKVIQSDTNWLGTYDFLLLVVININHGPILHCYQVNWGILIENMTFSYTLCL